MKKSVLIILAGALSLTQLNAQVEQGTLILGGAFGFNNSSSEQTFGTDDPMDGPSTSSFSITPYGMYCLSDKLAVGLGIGYSSYGYTVMSGADSDIEITDTESGFSVTPMARYYFVNDDRFMIWGALGVSIGSGTFTDESVGLDDDFNEIVESAESKFSTLGVAVGPGATIMLGEKCAFDFTFGSLGYSSYNYTDEGADAGAEDDYEYKESGFGINWANSFGFGISFFLN